MSNNFNIYDRQSRTREDIVMSTDGTNVRSHQFQNYEFDARASAPYTLDDRIFAVAMHANVST